MFLHCCFAYCIYTKLKGKNNSLMTCAALLHSRTISLCCQLAKQNLREYPSQVNKIAYYVIHLFIIFFCFLYMNKILVLTWEQWHQLHLFPLVIQFGYCVFGYCAAIAAPIRHDSRGLSVLVLFVPAWNIALISGVLRLILLFLIKLNQRLST